MLQQVRAALIAQDHVAASRLVEQLLTVTTDPVDRHLLENILVLSQRLAKSTSENGDEIHKDTRTSDEIAVLYLNSLIYGLGTGIVLAVHTEPDSPAEGILPALVLAGGSVGLVATLDHFAELRYGVPQSIVSGMTLGLQQGLVWTTWNQAQSNRRDEWEAETVAKVLWGSTTVGAVAGGLLATHLGTTPGRATYISSTGLWTGLVSGLLVGALADEKKDDKGLLAAALGLNAGATLGILTAGDASPSVARVRYLDLGAIAGGVVAGGLYLSAADDDPNPDPTMAWTAVGIAAGAGASWYLTRNMKKDLREGEEEDAPPVRASFVPTAGGGMLSLAGAF